MATAVTARHDLDPAELARRAADWLDRHPEPADRFVAVVADGDHPLADVGRTVERLVASESGAGAGRDPSLEPHSRMVVVLDRERRQPAGAARIVVHTGRALRHGARATGRTAAQIRSAHDIGDGAPVGELGAVAILPRYRGKRSAVQVGTLLYRALMLAGRTAGLRHVVAVLDRAAARNAIGLGTPFVPLAGAAPSAHGTRAVYGDLTRFERAFAEQAARLRRAARPGAGASVRGNDLKRLAVRRIAADIAGRLSTGDGLDERIILPA